MSEAASWFDSTAEEALCGGILLDPSLLDTLGLSTADFSPAWASTFGAMSNMHEAQQPVHLAALACSLGEEKTRALITASQTPASGLVAAHVAKEIRNLSQRRTAYAIMQGLALKIAEEKQFADVQPEIEARLLALLTEQAREAKSWKELLASAILRMQENHDRGGALRGVTSGFPRLDALTGGFVGGQLIVIGAATGGGKSALAAQFAMACSGRDTPALVYSLEMSNDELVARIIASKAGISLSRVLNKPLTESEIHAVSRASTRLLSDHRLIIEDESDLSIMRLRSSARRHAARNRLSIIVVDYCQLIVGTGRFNGENREREVAEVSRNLKQMAKELNVPVILLSQLNDDGHLRESRAIGHDADIVLKIMPVEGSETERELKIGKQRQGPRASVRLRFHSETTTFREIAAS